MSDPVEAHARSLLDALGVAERAVVDALPWAVIVTDAEGRIVLWNRPAEGLYGWAEAEVVGRFVFDVLVPVQERLSADEIFSSVTAGLSWRGDFTVRRRDGEQVRVFVIDSPITGADGSVVAVVGVSEDVGYQRLLEQQAADMAEHLALALDAGELGTWRWDRANGSITWDAQLETLYGLQPGMFPRTLDEFVPLLHPDDADAVLAATRQAIHDRARYSVEYRVVWPDGSLRWLQGKGQVVVSESGEVTGTMGCVADITDRVETATALEHAVAVARQAAENERVSAQRLAFIGQINDALALSSTRADVMRNVTRAAVPTLGDWCVIYVITGESDTPEMEVAHADPADVAVVDELRSRFVFDLQAATGVGAVIRTGQSEFYAHIDDDILANADVSDAGRSIVRSLRIRSAIIVPLMKRSRVVGALQFLNTDTSRLYTDDDLALARAVASRVASTLDNRRLSEEQRKIADTLQASLLPERLPTIPGIDVAVRYWAAGEHSTVGGDFYDVFEIGEREWAAVIGDVCGTGPLAASLTALTRHTIRAAAWSGASPDDVLRQLNHAMQQSGRETFCTALYCTLRPTPRGLRFSVATGGHPLPVIIRAGGEIEAIGTYGTALGVVADSRSTTESTDLRPGDTVVLYTDGVTDVPPPHSLDPTELETLISHATETADTAEQVAANLGSRLNQILPFTQRDDDIALLVLKAT